MRNQQVCLVHYINRYNQGKRLIDKGIAKSNYEIDLCNQKMNEALKNIVRIVTSDEFLNRAKYDPMIAGLS